MKLEEIKKYIEDNYSIQCETHVNYLNEQELLIKDIKYDITLQIEQPSEKHFLYGKCGYVIDCNYNANKKYQSELGHHGGGYSCECTYENIDKFLAQWFNKNDERQLNIFDYLKAGENNVEN